MKLQSHLINFFAQQIKQEFALKAEKMKQEEEEKIENVWIEANETIKTRVALVKDETKKELEEMVNEVELDCENQIQTLEYEIGWLKNQKETGEQTIERLRNALTKQEETTRKANEELLSDRVCHSFHKLSLLTRALQLQHHLKAKATEHTKEINNLLKQHSGSEKRWRTKIDKLEKRASKFEGNLKLISTTLLNHKRDALLEHKLKSREVATTINEISEKILTVDAKRHKVQSLIDNLVQGMHDVEKQLQDHSQISALQGGKINISHARKKRRLDEE